MRFKGKETEQVRMRMRTRTGLEEEVDETVWTSLICQSSGSEPNREWAG